MELELWKGQQVRALDFYREMKALATLTLYLPSHRLPVSSISQTPWVQRSRSPVDLVHKFSMLNVHQDEEG